MNTSRTFRLALLLGLTAAGALFAADAKTPSRVTVTFDHPEKYADVRDDMSDSENTTGAKHYLPLIEEYLQSRGDHLLAPGQQLAITFSDIDLAGDFEPWRGAHFDGVRILKDIYIPRMTFTFKVTDAKGAVVKEGERKLQDMSYLMRIGGFPSDSLRFEKEMLGDWLRDELRPAVAKN